MIWLLEMIYQYRKTFVCFAYKKPNTFEKIMDRYGHEKIFDKQSRGTMLVQESTIS